MVEVLHSGYLIPFHHFPHMVQKPIEFPSYGSGSEKAQALQDEVDKILVKDALELVD